MSERRADTPELTTEPQEGQKETVAPTTKGVTVTPETRKAMAAVLLQRPPLSQEEAEEVLAQHGFGKTSPSNP